jgi:hypothetical protein
MTQQDLTLTMRNSSKIFYARGRYLSFHTAKVISGPTQPLWTRSALPPKPDMATRFYEYTP